MKRTVSNSFEIKLDFEQNSENPSRLFKSFADIIEATSSLDSLVSRSINSDYSHKLLLEDIEKGSLIGKFIEWITINEDDTIDNIKDDEQPKSYVEGAREATLKFIQDGKSDVEDLKKLGDEIEAVAEESGIDKTFNYSPPDILELANTVNKVVDASQALKDGEQYVIKGEKEEKLPVSINNKAQKIDIDEVEASLTEEIIENIAELFYKVKKPDFLGDTQWEFKYGNRVRKAKILHEDWLRSFQSGEIVVLPGDSLRVKVRQVSRFDRQGRLISEKFEVIEVLNVRRGEDEN